MIPLWFIVWIALLFTWLGYETNWFTIHLPRYHRHIVTPVEIEELKRQFNWTSMCIPMCGWQWVYDHKDFSPEYRIELIIGTMREIIVAKDATVIGKAMKIYRTKHNPNKPIYPVSHYAPAPSLQFDWVNRS